MIAAHSNRDVPEEAAVPIVCTQHPPCQPPHVSTAFFPTLNALLTGQADSADLLKLERALGNGDDGAAPAAMSGRSVKASPLLPFTPENAEQAEARSNSLWSIVELPHSCRSVHHC